MSIQRLVFMNMERHIHGYGCYEYQALPWIQCLHNVYAMSCTRIQCLYNVLYSWIWSSIFKKWNFWILSSDLNTIQCLCHVLYKKTMSIQCLVFMNMQRRIHAYGFYEYQALTWIQGLHNVLFMNIDSMNMKLWPLCMGCGLLLLECVGSYMVSKMHRLPPVADLFPQKSH